MRYALTSAIAAATAAEQARVGRLGRGGRRAAAGAACRGGAGSSAGGAGAGAAGPRRGAGRCAAAAAGAPGGWPPLRRPRRSPFARLEDAAPLVRDARRGVLVVREELRDVGGVRPGQSRRVAAIPSVCCSKPAFAVLRARRRVRGPLRAEARRR